MENRRKEKLKSKRIKCIPNILTICNMAIGIMVICSMIHNHSLYNRRLACFMIYIAAILDGLDGYLARHLDAVSDMGKQLDSFADFITFGVAPITIFISNLDSISWLMKGVLLSYPIAGGFRLARYNLQESSEYFYGLPITAAGFINVTVILIQSYHYSEYTENFKTFYIIFSVVLSILMASKFRVNRILKIKN